MERVTREVRRLSDDLFRSTGVQLTALALRATPGAQWHTPRHGGSPGLGDPADLPTPSDADLQAPSSHAMVDAQVVFGAQVGPSGVTATPSFAEVDERRFDPVDVGTDTRSRGRRRTVGRRRSRERSRSRSRSRSRRRSPESDNEGRWRRLHLWSEENLERIRDLRDLHDVIDYRLQRVLRDRDRREIQHSQSRRSHIRLSSPDHLRHHEPSRRRSRARSSHRSSYRSRAQSSHRSRARSSHRSRARSSHRSGGRSSHRSRERRNRYRNRSSQRSDRSQPESANEAPTRCECQAEEVPRGEQDAPAPAPVLQEENITLPETEGAYPDYPSPQIQPNTEIIETITLNEDVEEQSRESQPLNSS